MKKFLVDPNGFSYFGSPRKLSFEKLYISQKHVLNDHLLQFLTMNQTPTPVMRITSVKLPMNDKHVKQSVSSLKSTKRSVRATRLEGATILKCSSC